MSTSLETGAEGLPGGGRPVAVPHRQAEAEAEARLFVASQWQLMWWRFRRHKLAMVSAAVTVLIYLVALFPEFLAPFPPGVHNAKYARYLLEVAHSKLDTLGVPR
jgi:hypothetical protein